MATARPQQHCYPSQALPVQDSWKADICTNCNADAMFYYYNCGSDGSEETNASPCATCNTVCQASKQAYCTIGHEYIEDHEDVGKYTSKPPRQCEAKDEFIFRNWTAEWWNELQTSYLTADKMGKTVPHNNGVSFPDGEAKPDPQNYPHPSGSLVTAKKYNDISNAVSKFRTSLAKVQGAAEVGCENATVIKAAHAIALRTSYQAAKFKTNVCDCCNTKAQWSFHCGCNCTCSCVCTCSCACSCGSPRNCGCTCSCSSSCTCGTGQVKTPQKKPTP